jgi:NAD(P)-dependent dehydrogenase (short-subunit alcohol dehydrogenase family)
MTNLFGAKSTTDQVLSGVNLHGKRILVTGVSAGIGIETARSLAAHGANVVGAAPGFAEGRSRYRRRARLCARFQQCRGALEEE